MRIALDSRMQVSVIVDEHLLKWTEPNNNLEKFTGRQFLRHSNADTASSWALPVHGVEEPPTFACSR